MNGAYEDGKYSVSEAGIPITHGPVISDTLMLKSFFAGFRAADELKNHRAVISNSIDFFGRLPDEMVVHIFSYLGKSDLTKSVCLVCHRFNNLALDPSVWTVLQNVCFCSSEDAALARHPFLKSLTLWCNVCGPLVATKALELCRQLFFLSLPYGITVNSTMLQAIGSSTSLRQLYLHVDDVLMNNVVCLRRLEVLELWINSKWDSSYLVAIGKHCKNLKKFELVGYGAITAQAMISFLNNVKYMIEELKVWGKVVEGTAFERLDECKLLTRLDIRSNSTSQFLKAVTNMPSLREFNLTMETHFVFGSRQNSQTYLSFHEADDHFLATVTGESWTELTRVTRLKCVNSNISDVVLGNVLQKCERLVELNLYVVGGITRKAFVGATTLRLLEIDSSKEVCIDRNKLHKIKCMLPQLKIRDQGKEWRYEKHGSTDSSYGV